ncbi:hypothetical protein HYS91_03460 [Candidatus Daviesbacteria bacterium]|nr:hypothetical protein [Candidatus Daviesbacteria bacterium]
MLKKHFLISFLIQVLLTLFLFRSILFNFSTNLYDWNDYPYVTWTIYQSLDNISDLRLDNFFDTNSFYPHKGTLLFSDLLLPQSLIALLPYLISQNPIVTFNFLFFVTIFLNIVASLFLWRKLTEDKRFIFFGSLLTSFSPFFFLNSNHFQMINLWPYLFSLGILFGKKLTVKGTFFISLLATILFLTSVYLCIFLLFSIFIWFLLRFIFERRNTNELLRFIKLATFFSIIFISLSGPFIFRYLQVKTSYIITRDYGEYVLYSAHISDYLFTTHYPSLIYSARPFTLWNRFDMHKVGESAGFPGITLLMLSVLGIFIYKKNKDFFYIRLPLSFNHLFFFILTFCGFIFSLGPRLNVSGTLIGIPLPYDLILKIMPLVEPVRATARWSLLFYLGLIYFSILGFKKLSLKYPFYLLLLIFSLLFVAEIFPVKIETQAKDYYPGAYQNIAKECKKSPKVLLEFPMTQFVLGANIISNLSYRTQMLLASTNHKCILINGYSGYIPTDYTRYEDSLFWAVENKDQDLFWKLLDEKKVNIFKLNRKNLFEEKDMVILEWMKKSNKIDVVYEDKDFFVASLKNK